MTTLTLRRWKLAVSVLIEIALLCVFVLLVAGHFTQAPRTIISFGFTFLGLLVSNLASGTIVGYIVANILWPRLDENRAHQEVRVESLGLSDTRVYQPEDKPSELTWLSYWIKKNHGSPLSGYLGFAERLVFVVAGLQSLNSFFAVAGAWTTIKIAVDWKMLTDIPHRGIGHIYLIGCLLSIFFGLLDVVVIRMLFGLPLGIIDAKLMSGAI